MIDSDQMGKKTFAIREKLGTARGRGGDGMIGAPDSVWFVG